MRAGRWLAECTPPGAYVVVINTTDFRILASWPLGFEGPSNCPGATYVAAVVVGASAKSIDDVGGAMVAGGLGLLDSEVALNTAPPLVFSIGDPGANAFTRQFNPPDRLGYGGLPFYYSTSRGGIVDGRTGQLICSSRCFVVAKLQVGTRSVILAWGLTGEDTRAAAAYLRSLAIEYLPYYWQGLLRATGNVALVVSWDYLTDSGYRYGTRYTTLAIWP